MTEERNEIEDNLTENIDSERVYTQIEQEELSKGWKPDGKKSAEEFRQYRDEYNNSLERIKSELKEQKQSVEYLVRQNAKIAEEGYQRALATLRQEQADAAMIGDVQTVSRVTDQLINLQNNAPPASLGFDPKPYQDFMQRNSSWYAPATVANAPANIVSMSRYADTKEEEIRTMNPHLSVPEVLNILEEDIRRTFPTAFLRNNAPTEVMGKGQHSGRASNAAFNDLPEFHKQMIMDHRANTKNFNEKAYISALNLINK